MKQEIPNIYNFESYAPFLKVKHKILRTLFSFHPDNWYPAQTKLHHTINYLKSQGKLIWLLILKARQEGVSTYSESRIFHATATRPNTNSLVLADKIDRSEYIFDMCKTFYAYLPKEIKPIKKHSNKKELIFDTKDGKGLKSAIFIATALDPYVGQSMTIHNIHVSEASSFPSISEVFTTLIPTVPETPDSIVIVESTAKGVAHEFYQEWQDAKAGNSIFHPIFFPWFLHPEYASPIVGKEKFSITTEERKFKNKFNLSYEQLKWRREAIDKKYRGDIDAFNQEYPATDQEAFIVTGDTVFNKNRLKEAYEHTIEPKIHLEVDVNLKDHYTLNYSVRENSEGRLWIWDTPQPQHTYRVSTDPAEGLEWGDYTAIEVFDQKTMTQVAEWNDHIDPVNLGYLVVAIAKLYNDAKLVIEVNNHGLTTQNEAKRFYWNFYFHQYIDRFANKPTDKLGWMTTLTFKKALISYMMHVVESGNWKFNSERLMGQFLTFVKRGDTGEAASGCYDDLVMATMINIYTAYQDGDIFEFSKGGVSGGMSRGQDKEQGALLRKYDHDDYEEEESSRVKHWMEL